MRYLLIILITLSLIGPVFANQPKYLKDAIITVTLKNGKTYKFAANEWKVVPRKDKKVCKPIRAKSKGVKHSVALLAGSSRSDLNVNVVGTTINSQVDREFVVGLEYRATLNSYFGEFAILNNDTILFGIGKEF